MKDDAEELMESYDQSTCDLQDSGSIFQRLFQSVTGTSSFKPFLNLFQHFLAIRNQHEVRKNYWGLINQVVTQIVLDKKGLEPDFSMKYRMPVTTLIEGFAGKDRYKQMVEDSKENKAKVESLAKDKEKMNAEWVENFGWDLFCFFFYCCCFVL